MCGIAGYFSTQNVFSSEELLAMGNVLQHRGPDAQGTYSDSKVGLIHRRLKIIDLSEAANQPMYSEDSRYAIIYNGEVYNYNDIRREYQMPVKTSSDTEVILKLLENKGIDACNEFNGMFAIALYDTKDQSLTLIRDRMGVKPLYYFWDGKNFAFASEIKALLQLSYIKNNTAINHVALHEFLHLGYTGKHATIYSNIYKLQSGAYLKISANEFYEKHYWNIHTKVSSQTITDEFQAKEMLRDLIQNSVRLRLRSDVPFGAFLSGGIDSSIVTAIAQRNVSEKLRTFTIGFSDSKYNESTHAKSIANYLGTDHTEMFVTQKDAMNLIPSILDVYDEPFADSSSIPTMLVSKLAKQSVTMTLSGDGGDELFMGYGAYTWAQRLQNPVLQATRKPLATLLSCGSDRLHRGGKVLNYSNKENIPSHIFSQEQGFFSRAELQKLMLSPLTESMCFDENAQVSGRVLNPIENQAFFDINYYLQEDLLAKVDRATMQYSLESRVPLLDYNVVEFALNLDHSLKIKNGIHKYLLKELLYDYVPSSFFNRPKWGFSIPLQTWLQTDLQYLIHDYLQESVVKKHSIVKYSEVEKLKRKYLQANQGHLYSRIWALILVHKFLEEKFLK